MTKVTMDSHPRELALKANIAMCQNEVQATEAIKEVEVYCAAAIKEVEACQVIHACTLEKSHKESMLELEHELIAEEGWDHQAFLEACGPVLWACPPEAHGVLMYPLHLLTGIMLLAPILGMLAITQQLATAGRKPMSQPPHLQCQRCQHPKLEPNGSTTHPTGKHPCQDQRKL